MRLATSTNAPGDWRHRAACLGEDPELFQPVTDAGPAFEAQVAAAKAVCARCKVRAECLVFALALLPFGIAGGLTEQERRDTRARSRGPGPTCRKPRRPEAGSPAEVAAAGRDAIRAGADIAEVARRFRVSKRTATRWAAQARAAAPSSTTDDTGTRTSVRAAEGSRGGNRAPLLVSQQRNPRQGLEQWKDVEGR